MELIQAILDKDYVTSALLLVVVWYFVKTIKVLQETHNIEISKITDKFINQLDKIGEKSTKYHNKEMKILDKISKNQDTIHKDVKALKK